ADQDPRRPQTGRAQLQAAVIRVAIAAPPPWPADEEDPAMAMHEMAVIETAVIKAVAGMTVPGGHMTGPCGHAGAAGDRGTAVAAPSGSHVPATPTTHMAATHATMAATHATMAAATAAAAACHG